MKILIDINHPAHFYLFVNFIHIMQKKGNQFIIISRDKEVTLQLLDSAGIKYIPRGKGYTNLLMKVFGIVLNSIKIYKYANLEKPDFLLGAGNPYVGIVGKILKLPVINFLNAEHAYWELIFVKYFSDVILTPRSFFKYLGLKQIKFDGNYEIASLHPRYYKFDDSRKNILDLDNECKYIILRFVSWKANHDVGQNGLDYNTKQLLVNYLSKYADVFISSEDKLPEQFKRYRINIPPEKMHDVLADANLYIGEGATMASESACLGTPAIYVNSLEVGYCTELEKKYGLVFNFRNPEGVLKKALELINTPNLKADFRKRRQKLFSDKIDVTAFLVWFVENYPESFRIMKDNPDYQYRFK